MFINCKKGTDATMKDYLQVVPKSKTTIMSRKSMLARDMALSTVRDLLPFITVNGKAKDCRWVMTKMQS